MQSTYKGKLDVLSILISALCMIHCIILPLLISTLSILSIDVLENHWLEVATILLTMLVGGTAIYRGFYKYHRNKLVSSLFIIGTVAMFAGNTMEAYGEMVLKLIGVVLISYAHIRNYRLSKKCAVYIS